MVTWKLVQNANSQAIRPDERESLRVDPGLSVLINSQAVSDTGKLRGGSAIENGRESGFLSFVHHIVHFFRSVVLKVGSVN